MKFNSIELEKIFIEKAKEDSISHAQSCIDSAINGAYKVNNIKDWVAYNEKVIQDTKNGKYDHFFGTIQKAYYYQTGESVAFL